MDKEKQEANKQRYIALCRQYIQRDGLDDVLAYLEKGDFYSAPSSSGYHLNEDGGLCQHSINVFETAVSIYENLLKDRFAAGTAAFDKEIPMESIAIAALFHDFCKIDFYRKTERWKKDEHNQWQSYDGYEITDNFPFGHGEKSVLLLHCYMKLKPDEMLAIRWHMGLFDMADFGTSQSYAFKNAVEKSSLVTLIQISDQLSANCLEKTTTH
jgi:hypothetical protein